jgi:tetratricopeptide (TPR) repeat protein
MKHGWTRSRGAGAQRRLGDTRAGGRRLLARALEAGLRRLVGARGRLLARAGMLAACALLGLSGTTQADSLADVFARGNAAFARGEYASAVREYEALSEAGIDDADVAFNLASSHGELGHYGQAIRYFERALRLSPRDAEARASLRRARDALGERQAQHSGEAIVEDRPPLTEAVFTYFSSDTLACTLLVAIWLACGLLIALPRVRREGARLGIGIAAAVLSSLALLSALGVAAKAEWGRAGERAVIVVETAALREGPDDRARLLGELLEGESVRVVGREGRFARVLARAQREAYVLSSELGEI